MNLHVMHALTDTAPDAALLVLLLFWLRAVQHGMGYADANGRRRIELTTDEHERRAKQVGASIAYALSALLLFVLPTVLALYWIACRPR